MSKLLQFVDTSKRLEHAKGELEGSLLMASLIIASGRKAAETGLSLSEFLDQVEALLQEHRP